MERTRHPEETKSEEEPPREETKSKEDLPQKMSHPEGSEQGIYYWPILPEELCQRWQVEKATR